MKQVLYLFLLIALPVLTAAQHPDSINTKIFDTASTTMRDSAGIKAKDSVAIKLDSLKKLQPPYRILLREILKENKFLDISSTPVAKKIYIRKQQPDDSVFYALLILVAALSFLRFFYVRYFNNLFQVFFNTSLRQSQLTDQLLQARLPSMLFNLTAAFSGGIFFYFLLKYFGWVNERKPLDVMLLSSFFVMAIYFLKYVSLKFTGWLSGYSNITNTYIFIIFLINKILGILLLPLIIVMAFSIPVLIKVSVMIAILLTALMFLLRFFRSYSLLQNQVKISAAHFMLYIAGVELMPLLLIYKALLFLSSKNI
ncbi:MAG: hypothetical protein JWR61_100 [Ferruginibacter sp.]|uniref:DUF4271 domain-containing protein n=1 Tax=Ferruginibacter sp. TaxID=1940288 RepID=UPI002658F6FB|nr:DUF4271 domain-containing protein [Ferruginibacter sp.]MDB5275145.1 hypothetical protein [Ferruginibacter sp.]